MKRFWTTTSAFLVSSILFISIQSWASASFNRCLEELHAVSDAIGFMSDPEAKEFGLPPRQSGRFLGERGHLGFLPKKDPDTEAKLTALGIAWWYTKVIVVRSFDEAIAAERLHETGPDLTKPFHKRKRQLHSRALYAILPDERFDTNMSAEETEALARKIVQRPLYRVRHSSDPTNGDWSSFRTDIDPFEEFDSMTLQPVDPQLVRERFDVSTAKIVEQFKGEGPHMRFFGWHFSDPYAFFMLNDLDDPKSKTVKDLTQVARKLMYPQPAKDGTPAKSRMRVTFNTALMEVMEGAMKQNRAGQDPDATRITPGMIQEYMKMQEKGQTICVEDWEETVHEDGSTTFELKSGIFGTVKNGIVNITSIFYPAIEVRREDGSMERVSSPERPRVLFLALRDRMRSAYKFKGNPFIVALMSTGWSQLLRAVYLSAPQAMGVIRQREIDAKFDFETEWTLAVSPEIAARPFGIVGVTPQHVTLSRSPFGQ